jgi:hypothetical protein
LNGSHVHTAAQATANVETIILCGTGEKVLGGGATTASNKQIYESFPAESGAPATDSEVPDGWGANATGAFTVYVVCTS